MLWIFIEYNLLYRLTFALEYIRSMIVYYYTYIFFLIHHIYISLHRPINQVDQTGGEMK